MAGFEDDRRANGPGPASGPHSPESPATPGDSAKSRGTSWVTMLAWIGLAFLVAGVIAYRLVMPFFAHR